MYNLPNYSRRCVSGLLLQSAEVTADLSLGTAQFR